MNSVILRLHHRLTAFPGKCPGKPAWLIASILVSLLVAACDKEPGAYMDAVVNLDGERVDPFHPTRTNAATVLVFLGVECPISNRYVPELRRLHTKFAEQNVGWWFVYPGTGYSLESIRQHVREFSVAGDVARDPQLTLARRAQVQMTPEVAIFLPHGRLVYHGRIDDRFPELTVERRAPTRRDLEETLEVIVAGGQVAPTHTQAVGCYIPGLP